MKPDNMKDKFAVAMVKSETVVGHVMKGKAGRFGKTIFYFFKASRCHKCWKLLVKQ